MITVFIVCMSINIRFPIQRVTNISHTYQTMNKHTEIKKRNGWYGKLLKSKTKVYRFALPFSRRNKRKRRCKSFFQWEENFSRLEIAWSASDVKKRHDAEDLKIYYTTCQEWLMQTVSAARWSSSFDNLMQFVEFRSCR